MPVRKAKPGPKSKARRPKRKTEKPQRQLKLTKKMTIAEQLYAVAEFHGVTVMGLLECSSFMAQHKLTPKKVTAQAKRDAAALESDASERLRQQVWDMNGTWNGKQSPAREEAKRRKRQAEEVTARPTGAPRTSRPKKVDRGAVILALLQESGPMSGKEIRAKLGLSSIAHIMKGLLESRAVTVTQKKPKGKLWQLANGETTASDRPKRKTSGRPKRKRK